MKYARLALDGGGCAGFTYKWEETNEVADGTLIEDTIIVDKLAEVYIYGSEIDYEEDIIKNLEFVNEVIKNDNNSTLKKEFISFENILRSLVL